MSKTTRCGYVALIGRPNVGKSTLLNKILQHKISITSHKPQTTRYKILGIKTRKNVQIIYVDTPGLHRKINQTMNHYLNRVALQSLQDVDVVGFIVEACHWTEEDDWILTRLKKINKPVLLIVNKVDLIHQKELLLPWIDQVSKKLAFVAVVPLSAKKGVNIPALEAEVSNLLPEGPALFPDDQLTDRSERFLAAEIIREKLTRYLHQELPYELTVEIEKFQLKDNLLSIHALIWLAKTGQKAIVIGEKGQGLKLIGQKARLEMEKIFGHKIFLKLWVKVKTNWSDDLKALQSLGYTEDH